MLEKVSIIGSGSWATALVKIFTESHIKVSWLVRENALARGIQQCGRNPRYLPHVDLQLKYLRTFVEHEAALEDTQAVIFAVPSSCLESFLTAIDSGWLDNKQVMVSIKGFIPGTGNLPSRYIEDYAGLANSVAVIAGPCNAEEIAMERDTYLTIAGEDAKAVQNISHSIKVKYIQTIENNDPLGVEYVAILKNIIGIAVGMANGLNYGQHFQSVLTSNAMREVSRFLQVMQPATRDLYDSAYFGDLLATAYSDYSRSKSLGRLIGRGIKTGPVLQSMKMDVEGFPASKELHLLIKHLNIPLPIINGVYRILHQDSNVFNEFKLIEKQLR